MYSEDWGQHLTMRNQLVSKGRQPPLKTKYFPASRSSLALSLLFRQLDASVMSHVVGLSTAFDICCMTCPFSYLLSTVKSGREDIKVI